MKDGGPGLLVTEPCLEARGSGKLPWRRTGPFQEGHCCTGATCTMSEPAPGDRRAPRQSARGPCVLLWGWGEMQNPTRKGTQTNKGSRAKSFSFLKEIERIIIIDLSMEQGKFYSKRNLERNHFEMIYPSVFQMPASTPLHQSLQGAYREHTFWAP